MALTAYTLLAYDADYSQIFNTVFLKASAQVYRGSLLGLQGTTGYARQLVAADFPLGFAEEDALGTSTDGAVSCGVRVAGAVTLAVTSAAATDLNKDVYASDGATFTYTATGNSFVGKVIRFDKTGYVTVAFDFTK